MGLLLMAVLALPKITALMPEPGAAQVSPHLPLRLTFNRPMQTASVEAALHLTPPISGTSRWEGTTLVFTPSTGWPEKTTITATLTGGRSAMGLPLLGETTWAFTVAGKRIAFITGVVSNVWLLPLELGAEAYPLTREINGVYNFSVSPDGTQVAYAALRADGGADLRMIGLDGQPARDLQLCPGEACLSPIFSPDGARLAYERHTVPTSVEGGESFGNSHIHLYTFATDSEMRVDRTSLDARYPRWGPDGRLSYYDTERQAIVIQDLTTGAITFVPNQTGDMGSWSPHGEALVYPEIVFPDPDTHWPGANFVDRFYSQLWRVTIATNQTQNLSGEGLVSDVTPVYSPSGAWVVFGRRGLTPATWTLGRQLWLMRADGSDAHPLTTDPTFNHSAFVWTADETAILYMRFNAGDPVTPAEIWMMNRDGTQARRLTVGYLPVWVP
jgi:Tol biopolymer transport system component